MFSDLEPAEKLYERQVVRIVTSDFPRYFAVVTRYRHESKVIGAEGDVISSKVIPQVQVVFPKNAIQNKNIRVALQVIANRQLFGLLISIRVIVNIMIAYY